MLDMCIQCIQITLVIHRIAISVQNMKYRKYKTCLYNSLAKQLLIMIADYIFAKVQECTVITEFKILFDIGSTECGPMLPDFQENQMFTVKGYPRKVFCFFSPKTIPNRIFFGKDSDRNSFSRATDSFLTYKTILSFLDIPTHSKHVSKLPQQLI